MPYRKRANKKYDRKMFSRTANRIHKKNLIALPMRGGFRI